MLLLSVAVAGYAASIVAGDPLWPWMAVWFVAAVVVHDGVLSPLAAVADAVLRFCLRWFPASRPADDVNYIRVPALGAALTFLMFLPGIIRQGEPVVVGQTGLDQARSSAVGCCSSPRWRRVSALVYGRAPAHQTVSSRWLTASASSAWAASHARGPGQQRARHHQPHRERQPDPFHLGLGQPGQVGDDDRRQRGEHQQRRRGREAPAALATARRIPA